MFLSSDISNLMHHLHATYQEFADLSQFSDETGWQDHNEQTGGDGRNFILWNKEHNTCGQRDYLHKHTLWEHANILEVRAELSITR